jgi:hypothetical protein
MPFSAGEKLGPYQNRRADRQGGKGRMVHCLDTTRIMKDGALPSVAGITRPDINTLAGIRIEVFMTI